MINNLLLYYKYIYITIFKHRLDEPEIKYFVFFKILQNILYVFLLATLLFFDL